MINYCCGSSAATPQPSPVACVVMKMMTRRQETVVLSSRRCTAAVRVCIVLLSAHPSIRRTVTLRRFASVCTSHLCGGYECESQARNGSAVVVWLLIKLAAQPHNRNRGHAAQTHSIALCRCDHLPLVCRAMLSPAMSAYRIHLLHTRATSLQHYGANCVVQRRRAASESHYTPCVSRFAAY